MSFKDKLPWLLGGAGALGLLFAGRKQVMTLTGRVIQAGQEWAFGNAIPSDAQPYAGLILQVASATGLDPFLIVALGQKESNWGRTLHADGTGDYSVRNSAPAGVPVVSSGNGVVPADGGGWGRGIMQIDYASNYGWLSSNDWRDPAVNVRKGADILLQKRNYLTATPSTPNVTLSQSQANARGVQPGTYRDPRPLTGDVLLAATLAAYNTGELNALRSVAAGVSPDTTTTGGGYGQDALAKIAVMLSEFNNLIGGNA